ncbi:MAG: trypsin-like serine protease [Kofleriaceae bacterium]
MGGDPAALGDLPAVVAIEVGATLCTGTLISSEWVLTAAHCVYPTDDAPTQADVTASIRVHVGTVDLVADPGTVVTATESIPHPEFTILAIGIHDVGLIRLATPLSMVPVIRVNLDPARAPVGIAITQAGFGISGDESRRRLHTVEQTSVSCAALPSGPSLSDARMLCVDQRDGRGPCDGDSGGPSLATTNGERRQVALASFGDSMCAQYGAATRTDAEASFLLAHVPELRCDSDAECGEGKVCLAETCIVEPFTPLGAGAECMAASDCESGYCTVGPDGSSETRCTEPCEPGDAGACPLGFECLAIAAGEGACWPAIAPGAAGGCATTGRAPSSVALWTIVMVLLGMWRRKLGRT